MRYLQTPPPSWSWRSGLCSSSCPSAAPVSRGPPAYRNEHGWITGSIKAPSRRLRKLRRHRSPRLSTRVPRCFTVDPSALPSPPSKFPSRHRFFLPAPPLSSSRVFLSSFLRVYFAQQLPHRAVVHLEPSLRGNALSGGEKGGGGGITAGLLIRSNAPLPPPPPPPPPSRLASYRSWVLISPYLGMKCSLHSRVCCIDQTGNCSSAEPEAKIKTATGCSVSCAPTSQPLKHSVEKGRT